ncbi:hypothetical protein [Streptomyces sp. BPTC-684]|uniref:hypothetical protein n=1 Tax=Streptomyces sp. BPTC-684 TaxID=3043734 RepID=UPI0024B22424|nr:hypothetical protein [Streptomyces sp. BPTC-684]WHM40875.1 hypothetical protein QIY60_31015 [Streptomyces sp. BPTC-684]
MYVERCHLDHTVCEILGSRQIGGTWTTSAGNNYNLTRSGMFYDPAGMPGGTSPPHGIRPGNG